MQENSLRRDRKKDSTKKIFKKNSYRDPTKDKKDIHLKLKQTIVKEIKGKKVSFDIMSDIEAIIKDGLW